MLFRSVSFVRRGKAETEGAGVSLTISFVIGIYRVRISARIPAILQEISWLSSVPPCRYRDNTSTRSFPLRLLFDVLSTRAEVKKMWIYTSTPPYVFMA
jgi:hypothetical protein